MSRWSKLDVGIPVRAATKVVQLFWPDFVEMNGCVFARFQCGDGPLNELSDGKTETECLVNHTHVLDEFQNQATSEQAEHVSEELDVVEAAYDTEHPDFLAACEIGRKMAQLWAMKLKLDFPHERFRVYYTQYDNPIVRFHKVRTSEPLWLSDEQLRDATDRSFASALIYDTDYLDKPVVKEQIRPN